MSIIVRHLISWRAAFLSLSLVGSCLATAETKAFTFTETFSSSTLNPQLSLSSNPGFGVNLDTDKANFYQQAGYGNGGVFLTTKFRVLGDFVATVDVSRASSTGGKAQFGLSAIFPEQAPLPFANIFFTQYPNYAIWSNIGQDGNIPASNGTLTAVSATTLRMSRTGTTLSVYADLGSGFQLLNQYASPSFSGSSQLVLFLTQEFGSSASDFGSFDNWHIQSAGVVPEPGTAIYFLAGAACLVRLTRQRTSRSVAA